LGYWRKILYIISQQCYLSDNLIFESPYVKSIITEDFQENRLTQQSYKSLAICEEVIVYLISRISGVGSAEESGNNTIICLASNHKAVNNSLKVLLYFLQCGCFPL